MVNGLSNNELKEFLDSKSSDLLHKLFFDLRKKLNITFIIVTHNKELSNMTDRKLNLVDGKWA